MRPSACRLFVAGLLLVTLVVSATPSQAFTACWTCRVRQVNIYAPDGSLSATMEIEICDIVTGAGVGADFCGYDSQGGCVLGWFPRVIQHA